jgi:hypothetical protein
MATLEQQRRAIGAGITQARAATGESERKATGKRMEAERRGESVVEDINSLVAPAKPRRTLRTVPLVGAVPAGRGRADYTPPVTSTGGGIASPLTETDYALREFHPSLYLQSADGIFVWEIKPPSKIVMEDANGAPVEQVFAVPV